MTVIVSCKATATSLFACPSDLHSIATPGWILCTCVCVCVSLLLICSRIIEIRSNKQADNHLNQAPRVWNSFSTPAKISFDSLLPSFCSLLLHLLGLSLVPVSDSKFRPGLWKISPLDLNASLHPHNLLRSFLFCRFHYFFPSWVFCICGLGQQVLPNVSIGHISTVESEKGPVPPSEAAGFGRFNHLPVVLGLSVRPDHLFLVVLSPCSLGGCLKCCSLIILPCLFVVLSDSEFQLRRS